MRTFIKIFIGSDPSQVDKSVNEFAKEKSVEIVNANSFIWQGVVYTTVVFEQHESAEAPKPRTRAKKEIEMPKE